MCLINFHLREHPNYKLIVAANRDESYDRPTASAHFWEDNPKILAGRDLLQMGTWLGITKHGRFAALTNFRDPTQISSNKISRGEIVKSYLVGDLSPQHFLESLKKNKENYDGFNVIVGSPERLFYYGNMQDKIIEIPNGTHGLSNHLLNTPWPKVKNGKQMLRDYVMGENKIEPHHLFDILSNADVAEETDLPQTGVSLDLERQLSPLFIKTPYYGTRCSTVLLIDNNNIVTFVERTYNMGKFTKDNQFSFQLS